MEQTDLFGVLTYDQKIEFDGGVISPVDNFEDVKEWIENYKNEDGFLYPPYCSRWKVDPRTEKPIEEIPRTKRCAHLYRIPASHEIQLFDYTEKKEQVRYGLGGFILYLLAYLFGTRLQFYDWWIDGRIPITDKARTNDFYIDRHDIGNFLSHSINVYNKWKEKDKKLFANIIYFFSRSPSYEWDWERFIIEYMAFDGCFKLAKSLYRINGKKHKDRFVIICKYFGIPYEEKIDIIDKICRLRNDLFHETLWDGGLPGHALSEITFRSSQYLRRLNHRIIPALLDYRTPYINTGWWYLGQWIFEPPNL